MREERGRSEHIHSVRDENAGKLVDWAIVGLHQLSTVREKREENWCNATRIHWGYNNCGLEEGGKEHLHHNYYSKDGMDSRLERNMNSML